MAETVTRFPGPEDGSPAAADADAADAQGALRLGEWLFEPALNRLSGDETVRLEPKLASLLALLARRAGRVVSKEEIVEEVWDGAFIADSALTRAMAELRRALGDDARDPRYIETISKKGYRLLVTPEPPEASSSSPTGASRLPLYLGAAAAAAIALAAALLTLRPETPPPTRPAISSLVVLPLEDHSPDAEGEYFAASMTEALATDLARVGALRVISRRSVEQYVRQSGSLADAASALGADAALEGAIVRADGRVRIDVQLTDAATATHLWAESYERDFVDVLALQSDIASAVTREISASTSLAAVDRGPAPRVDPAAHDLYLKGRHAARKIAHDGPNEAEALYERALAIDPSFALAWAGLADYHSRLTLFDWMPPHEGFPKARNAALRALELDPDLGEAQAALAHVEFLFDWDWEQAEARFLRALELNPSSAEAHRAYAFFLTCMGRFDEALERARTEAELDPLSYSQVPWVLFNAQRYRESLAAIAELEKGYEKTPPMVGWNYAMLGRHEEAAEILAGVVSGSDGASPTQLAVLSWTLASAGREAEARETLRRLESVTASFDGDLYPLVVAHAGFGEVDRAMDLLEEAVTQRSPNAVFLRVEPFLEPLRESPRYQRLLRSTRLAPV